MNYNTEPCDKAISQIDEALHSMQNQVANICDVCDALMDRIKPVCIIPPPQPPDQARLNPKPTEARCSVASDLYQIRDQLSLKVEQLKSTIDRLCL